MTRISTSANEWGTVLSDTTMSVASEITGIPVGPEAQASLISVHPGAFGAFLILTGVVLLFSTRIIRVIATVALLAGIAVVAYSFSPEILAMVS